MDLLSSSQGSAPCLRKDGKRQGAGFGRCRVLRKKLMDQNSKKSSYESVTAE